LKDKSGEWGSLNHYDYGFRIYNPAIAKFLSVDPLTASYPWYTPYQFAGNKPIGAIDLDGLQEKWVTFYQFKNESGYDLRKTEIKIDKEAEIYNQSQERVAVTHIKIINGNNDIVAEWDMHECVDECTGLMSNGFEPTAMYNLNAFDPKNEIQKAKEVNGADNYYWITDYLEITDGKTLEFNKHLNSSPEKKAELQDLDDVIIALSALSGRSGNSDASTLGVKRKPRTSTEHTKGARPSTEQKHQENQARQAAEQKAADERYSKTKSTKVSKTNNQKKRDNPNYKKPGPKNN
jgi:RHS repeat-associated protein